MWCVATYFPIIPLGILVVLFAVSVSGIRSFQPASALEVDAAQQAATPAVAPLATQWEVVCVMLTAIIGFFATAGAAGADFGMNNRNGSDVQLGGLVGIAGATILAGGLSLLIVAVATGWVLARRS